MNRVGLTDTAPEAQRVLTDVYRRMAPSHKLQLQVEGYRCERSLHEAGLRLRQPDATRSDIQKSWNRIRLGQGPWESVGNRSLDQSINNLDVVRDVTAAFTGLGIPYALGGSWASSFYGEPRSSPNADIIVEPFPGQESALVASFGPDYYVSLEAVKRAVREARTFSIINRIAGFKVDVLFPRDAAFDRSVMSRRDEVTTEGDPAHPLVMISPEDTILLELQLYRLWGETTERQWLDVLGVLRIQSDRLDLAYLDHWAAELGVADLLANARCDATL